MYLDDDDVLTTATVAILLSITHTPTFDRGLSYSLLFFPTAPPTRPSRLMVNGRQTRFHSDKRRRAKTNAKSLHDLKLKIWRIGGSFDSNRESTIATPQRDGMEFARMSKEDYEDARHSQVKLGGATARSG